MAADMRMPVKAPPPVVAAVYNWTGFYIGGHAGYAWGRSKTEVGQPDALDCGGGASCETISHKTDGAFGGLHAGYNWQVNSIVFGLEAEAGYIGAKGSVFSTIAPDHFFSAKYGAYGAFTGRLGFAADRMLFYGKGGLVVAAVKNEAFDDFTPPPGDPDHIGRKSGARVGWTGGGGIEYAIGNNWTARVEYLYMQFKRETVFDVGDGGDGPASPYTFRNHLHTVRAGLSYRFGGPVVARY
jgi:outer membrane immunogenic protein